MLFIPCSNTCVNIFPGCVVVFDFTHSLHACLLGCCTGSSAIEEGKGSIHQYRNTDWVRGIVVRNGGKQPRLLCGYQSCWIVFFFSTS